MIITGSLAAFISFSIAVITFFVVRGERKLVGKRWLMTFIALVACYFLLPWLSRVLFYIGLERIAAKVDTFLVYHGYWFSTLLSILVWLSFLAFVLLQHSTYGRGSRAHHVYENRTNSVTCTERVTSGFSWPAFWLGAIWAYYKRMPIVGTALVVGNIIVAFAIDFVASTNFSRDMMNVVGNSHFPQWLYSLLVSALLALSWLFLVGYFGNAWHERSLAKKGYKRSG